MSLTTQHSLRIGSTDRVLQALSTRQHVHPRQSVRLALRLVAAEAGLSFIAAEEAIQVLGLDPAISIGRLKRTELSHLAGIVRRLNQCVSLDIAAA